MSENGQQKRIPSEIPDLCQEYAALRSDWQENQAKGTPDESAQGDRRSISQVLSGFRV